MKQIKDGIHNCISCELYPCTMQEEIDGDDICRLCPIPSRCCNMPILPIMPCEEKLNITFTKEGWCIYYKDGCTIHNKRPIACRIASCRWIREGKIPNEIQN